MVDQVGQNLGGGGNRDTALVTELVKTALHTEVGKPVLTVGGTTSHGTQQLGIDLNNLLDGLTSDPVSCSGSGVGRHNDTALESEGEGRCTVSELDGAAGVRVVVGHCAEP